MKKSGFTIVEVLTVIVIIGILAAITIVSYNGVTVLAENSKTVTAVQQTESILRRIKAETGKYPVTSDDIPHNPCVGTYADGKCSNYTDGDGIGYPSASVSPAFDALLKQYNRSAIPQPSTQDIMFNGSQPHRGLWVGLGNGSSASLRWFVKSTEPCGLDGSTIVHQDQNGKACLKLLN